MNKRSFTFSSSTVNYYFDASFIYLETLLNREQTVLLVDEKFSLKNKRNLAGWKMIVIPSGEQYKVQSTVDRIIDQLIQFGADKSTTLVGIGGGVVTDITGYIASVYKRGLPFAFVPTTVLAMTDAAIGGKNGINAGLQKNMIGTIRQPQFILYDYTLLKSLPKEEWINGFAEIIKHACTHDAAMFKKLEGADLSFFQKKINELAKLIQKNVLLKSRVVMKDEFEKGERKLLNFGHTIGHAVENLYQIPHGHAISIGMSVACKISELLTGFKESDRVISLLKRYGLTPFLTFDKEETWKLILSDKKVSKDTIDYIILNKIGRGSIAPLSLDEFYTLI